MNNYEININPSEIDPDGTTYRGKFKKINDIEGSSQCGSAAIPTCTVKFVNGGNGQCLGIYSYTKLENGAITPVSINTGEYMDEFEITLEDVICGTVIYFSWSYTGDVGEVYITGGASQLENNMAVNESPLFRAPMTAGEVCTIEIHGRAEFEW